MYVVTDRQLPTAAVFMNEMTARQFFRLLMKKGYVPTLIEVEKEETTCKQ